MSLEKLADHVMRFAERFGVPCLLLFALVWMVREAAIGLHASVVLPVVESHQQFLDTLCTEAQKQTEAMRQQAKSFDELSRSHAEQTNLLRRALPGAPIAGSPSTVPSDLQ